MSFFRAKWVLAFALLAAFVFFSLSLGGEILHRAVHHHQSQASHDACPIFQLLAQAFLFVIALLFAVQKRIFSPVVYSPVVVFFRQYRLPSLRAPPVSL